MFSMLSWFISLMPDSLLMWIFYGSAGLGLLLILISWFIWFIPFINSYRFLVQVVGVIVFGVGAFFSGGYGIEAMWRERVAEMEAKVKAAEEKSAQVNTVIKEKIVYKTQVIKQKEIEYVDRIKEVEKVIDAKCEIDPAAIEILNNAATDPTKGTSK